MLRIIIIHYWNASKPTSIVELQRLCVQPLLVEDYMEVLYYTQHENI